MNNDYFKIFQDLGLSDKESRVYFALLELGEAMASAIARRSNLKRSTAYIVLENLKEKGLVSTFLFKKKQYFRALDPSLFRDNYYRKLERLDEAIPFLDVIKNKYMVKPQMTLYEGKDGLIEMMEDTLNVTNLELLVWANMELAVNTTLSSYYSEYVKKKVQKKIWVKGIFSDGPTARLFREKGTEELREVYLIPADEFPFKNEINIYDDKVAIVSHEDEVGVIIQNRAIAETQKSIFKFGLEYAKKLNL